MFRQGDSLEDCIEIRIGQGKLDIQSGHVAEGEVAGDVNCNDLSVNEIIDSILERIGDPVIEQMVLAVRRKIPKENGKRERSVVLAGLSKAPPEQSLLDKKQHQRRMWPR
ncbi:unnamed protein product [Cylicocyclus nassatus]|uniref:Uncharacterized protein n=1 Tax=Cylicocyclus nassatus TaxID=53992 RepID=A0AA36M1V7_CYLNA|nr:unnamed protein product [Cylicocyclus nassatus]